MVFKKTVKNTNTTTEEYTVEQERYLEYHSAKKRLAGKWQKISFVFILIIASIVCWLCSLPNTETLVFSVLILSQIAFIVWTLKSNKGNIKMNTGLMILSWIFPFFIYINLPSPMLYLMLASLFILAFIALIPLHHLTSEGNSLTNAEKILPYMRQTATTEHTAVIFPHNKNRPADGGDGVALKLLEGLKQYREDFQIYFCLTSEEMIRALTNPMVRRIWIFGHGNRGGCGLTDGQFIYSEHMLERTEDGWELRKITPKEYVYQCHCNREKLQSLADYLVLEKGVLDSSVDDMPNYFDTGFIGMESVSSKKYGKLYVTQKVSKVLNAIFKKDFNYMSDDSAEYVIDRYLAHLEKKQKISE